MKRILLIAITLMIGVSVMAQLKPVTMSKSLTNKVLPAPVAIDQVNTFNQPGNVVVNSKAALDDIIGSSRYDMQSNASMMSRLYLWPDGSLSGTWTMGMNDGGGYPDRGTGYNYSTGSDWGNTPTERIETVKTGWPNIHPWNGNGEVVLAHQSGTTGLVLSTRPAKGTGSWTQTIIAPAPAAGLLWPRMITSGPTHNYVHIITMTSPVANGGQLFNGMDGALVYYRSLNGGTTWDKSCVQLPGLTSTEYLGFGGDDYAWVEPHGDTLAFVVGGGWTDTFLMYSFDNGNTWTKKIIMPNYYNLSPNTVATPAFIACDGTVAGAMDKDGVFHVAFGRMRVTCDGSGATQYYPGTDGIVYWNSTQAALDTAIITNIDSCYEHGILLGYVAANSAGDTIVDFPTYGTSLSSWPQVTVDDYNNVYFLWSSLTVGNPSPDPYNYRHIWGRAWFNGKSEWTEMIDLNEGVFYMFQEYAYPALAKSMKNDKLQIISQTSAQPGSQIKDANIPVHDVNIEYREVDASIFWPVGVDNKTAASNNVVGKNYPNPVKGITYFSVKLEKAANVTVEVSNVMGQKIMTMDKGAVNAGSQVYSIDASQLSTGIYFYTVKINGQSYTHKMIVE